MWRFLVAAFIVVTTVTLLNELGRNTAHACSGDPSSVSEADRVLAASVIVSGRFTGYHVVADELISGPVADVAKGGSLVRLPVQLDLDVAQVIRGDVESSQIAIVLDTWITSMAPERDEYEWFVASGGCGFLAKNDPTDKYVVLSLSQQDSGVYQMTHLFFGGDDPAELAMTADRLTSLPATGPEGSGSTSSGLPGTVLVGAGLVIAAIALALTAVILRARTRRNA